MNGVTPTAPLQSVRYRFEVPPVRLSHGPAFAFLAACFQPTGCSPATQSPTNKLHTSHCDSNSPLASYELPRSII